MEEFLRIGGRDRKASDGKGSISTSSASTTSSSSSARSTCRPSSPTSGASARRGPGHPFYEYFMEVYDKAEKVRRGVFYTPRPVVSFIVRSVDEILRDNFGLPLGLADAATWDRWPRSTRT